MDMYDIIVQPSTSYYEVLERRQKKPDSGKSLRKMLCVI